MFSILICTLEQRKEQFDKLHQHLLKQIIDNKYENDVEILVYSDNREMPVGIKRNTLLNTASKKYVAFIDDDDWVPDDYISTIMTILKNSPDIDCIGMKGLLIDHILGKKVFIHSIRYKGYSEDEKFFYRPCNHLNPIKRELVVNFEFPIINFGEDSDWTMRICKAGVLKNEVFLDKIMYYYHFNRFTTQTQVVL